MKDKDKVNELRGKLYDIAKANPERRFHSLYDKIQRMDVLKEAWESVRKNGGSPGIDGITTGKLKKDGIEPILTEIQAELKARTYTPSPLKRVYIPKANGKQRPLSIPTVKDRITQTAIKIIIEPIFETQFEPNSFGFRFVRQYSSWKRKRVTRWFPSPKSELKIRKRILNLTGNSARSLTTPEEAKELLIPVLRGWGNYFAHSLASKSFADVWDYAQRRLMYMYCHQHNIPRKWKNRNIPKYNLSIMCTKPSTFLGKRHNAMS